MIDSASPAGERPHDIGPTEIENALAIWRRHSPHLEWAAAIAVAIADQRDAALASVTDDERLDVPTLAKALHATARNLGEGLAICAGPESHQRMAMAIAAEYERLRRERTVR